MIKVSEIFGLRDNRPQSLTCTWNELARTLLVHDHRDVREGPLFSPAEFDGLGRKDDNVKALHFGVLDFDDCPAQVFADNWQRAQAYDAIAYSTWKYAPGPTVRARIILPFTRPVLPHEWPRVWGTLVAMFPGADRQCSDLSRSYFYPSCPRISFPVAALAAGWQDGARAFDVHTVAPTQALAVIQTRGQVTAALDPLPAGALKRYARKLSNKTDPEQAMIGSIMLTGLAGHEMAGTGNRDNTLFRLACALAEGFVNSDADEIAQEFAAAISHWQAADSPTVEIFAEKIRRKQDEQRETRSQARGALGERQAENVQMLLGRAHPYTPEEIAALERDHAYPLRRRWLLAQGSQVWTLIGETYRGPFDGNSQGAAVAQALSPASSAGVSVYAVTQQGVDVKPVGTLLREYGLVLDAVEADLTADRARLAPDRRVLVEAPCPLKAIEPVYDPEIAEWLRLLAGGKEDALLDWIATVTCLDRPAPALYLQGPAGAGKTLLALGLARLWSSSPSALENVLAGFNDELLRCPLVFADERIPCDRFGAPRTEDLRALITQSEFTINQKFRKPFVARGACRLILATQKPNLISRGAELTADDVKALSDRFVYCQPHANAAQWLAERGGPALTERWVNGGALAAHARWLYDAACTGVRAVKRGSRLIIPADSDELAQFLRASSGVRWSIMFWLVAYLRDPGIHMRGSVQRAPAVFVKENALWVAPTRLAECWDQYLVNERPPSVQQVTTALKALVVSSKRTREGLNRMRYFSIDLGALSSWCEEQGEPFPDLNETQEFQARLTN